MFHEALGGLWGMEREIIGLQRSETMDLRRLRRKNMTGAIIPALMHRTPSELRSEACLGESSTIMGDFLGSRLVATPVLGSYGYHSGVPFFIPLGLALSLAIGVGRSSI